MTKAYARLKIKESKNILNFSKFSYVANFVTSAGRVGTTNKVAIQANGLGVEVSFDLNPKEVPDKTTVSFKIFLPSGTQYNPRIVIYGHTYIKEANSKPLITEYDLKLFQDKTLKEDEHRVPNRIIPTTYPVPEGLRMVAYLRNEIKSAGANNGIDPQIVASIVFEEKMHGVWAFRKNLLSFYLNLGEVYPHNSYGFGEMQLGLAAELMNIDKRNPDWLYETFVVICTDATVAMDLVAKNVVRGGKILGRKLTLQESTVFYNAGEKALNSWIKGEIPKKRLENAVYARSWKWQEAIKLALNGDVIAIPDGCEGTCRADPERQVETWKFDPSLKLSL
ncbi:hypothetical protein ACG91D_08355 [Acinetobacter guillouiae]|jgi:hypothetical protein|uniref:hypothetical protein n=1 Tax=Acinetobacter guillouiae TaxID=106649 RepID=UPI0002CDDA1D|nr:hypothetical protein [Acinetobacter guillouiae]ENU58857.1 hypothetical protein F981_03165 [Acinetobacter guillouiae CIP 63.46]EPH38102.1 hypothetical protein L291_4307 [Acinetobacter guillouiae MSP4-18]KAB0625612.1 hypothetical protein F7P82_14950 [Acinetobacter guillouiae]